MITVNFEAESNAMPGMRGGSYNVGQAKIDVCERHLPPSAYTLREAHGPRGTEITGVTLNMTGDELRDALEQLDAHADELRQESKALAAEHGAYVAKRTADLTAARDSVHAVLAPVAGLHDGFKAALKALAKVDDELSTLATSKPNRASAPASLRTLREVLADELKRIEAATAAEDAKILDLLRRKGVAV